MCVNANCLPSIFFFQAEDGIRDLVRSRGLGDVYKRQQLTSVLYVVQRMTALSSMFVLIALLLHVWARQQKSLGWKNLVCLIAAWGLFLPMAMPVSYTHLTLPTSDLV